MDTPLWTVLLATSLGAEARLSTQRVAGVLGGFAGVVIVAEPWSADFSGSLIGALACLTAALSYAVAYTYQGRYLTNRGVSPTALTAIQLSIASAMLATALPLSGPAPSTTLSIVPWIAIAVLGVAGTGFALIINFTLIGTEGATAASVVTYLVPAVALALGAVVLDESVSPALPIGGLWILLGIGLVRYPIRGRSGRVSGE